jgi:hypothetical protein
MSADKLIIKPANEWKADSIKALDESMQSFDEMQKAFN